MSKKGDLMIFSGNANIPLAKAICKHLKKRLSSAVVKKFSDGETYVEIGQNVRGKDVFVIQPTNAPANDHLMELILMADALRRASARRITAVMVYYGYSRQDRKVMPRVPISAKVVAEMLMAVGVRRVLTMDLHSGQIQGFFNIPVDNMYAQPIFIADIKERFAGKDIIMVSPDAGGVERTRSSAKILKIGLAIIDKRREEANESEVMNVIGDVAGKDCILLDDMVDTAGTLCNGADELLNKGAKEVHAYCTHGVLSGPAISRIANSKIKSLTITDSIFQSPASKKCRKIRTLSVAPLMGDSIKTIHNDKGSLSDLFV